jgi:hypothetical protein
LEEIDLRYKPRIATPDEVTIRRDGNYAVLTFIDGEGGVNFGIGPELEFMDDQEILERYNECVRAQLDLATSWRPTEISDGHAQIKYDRRVGEWCARGHVLRCVIDSSPIDDELIIEIDNHVLSLQEFGAMCQIQKPSSVRT